MINNEQRNNIINRLLSIKNEIKGIRNILNDEESHKILSNMDIEFIVLIEKMKEK